MGNLFQNIQDILTAPFVGQVDMEQLFLIVGFIIVAAIVWFLIFQYIQYTASEVL